MIKCSGTGLSCFVFHCATNKRCVFHDQSLYAAKSLRDMPPDLRGMPQLVLVQLVCKRSTNCLPVISLKAANLWYLKYGKSQYRKLMP